MTNNFAKHGGVVTAKALLRTGLRPADLQRLSRSGALTRLRPGWYCYPTAVKTVRQAVEAGGCLSCISALRYHGLWTPTVPGIHVRRSEALRNLPTRKEVQIC